MTGRPVGSPCQISPYDTDADTVVEEGHFIRTEAGSCYLVTKARQVRRREPAPEWRRWVLQCLRVASIPPDATVHPLYWYSRRRRAELDMAAR